MWKVKRLRILVFVYYCKIGIWEGLDAACFLFCCCNIVVAKKTVGGRFFGRAYDDGRGTLAFFLRIVSVWRRRLPEE